MTQPIDWTKPLSFEGFDPFDLRPEVVECIEDTDTCVSIGMR